MLSPQYFPYKGTVNGLSNDRLRPVQERCLHGVYYGQDHRIVKTIRRRIEEEAGTLILSRKSLLDVAVRGECCTEEPVQLASPPAVGSGCECR